jgi:membrane protease YdiL (CAAX protease family)
MSDVSRARNAVVLLAVLVEGGLIVLAWLLGWLLGYPPVPQIKWNSRDALLGLALTLPLLALFLVLIRWPVGPLRRIKRFSEEVLSPVLAPCTRIDLLGISVLAGLGEELLFRGVMQAAFSSWLGLGWGLAIASILFGVMHAVTFTYAVLATVMGAYLGWLWVWTDNLLVPIVVHALYDFVVLWYLLYGPGMPPGLRVPAAEVGPQGPGEEEPAGAEDVPE